MCFGPPPNREVPTVPCMAAPHSPALPDQGHGAYFLAGFGLYYMQPIKNARQAFASPAPDTVGVACRCGYTNAVLCNVRRQRANMTVYMIVAWQLGKVNRRKPISTIFTKYLCKSLAFSLKRVYTMCNLVFKTMSCDMILHILVLERMNLMEQTMNPRPATLANQHNDLRAKKRRRLGLPRYTLGEEIFSAVSHGVSAILAVVGLVLLLVFGKKTTLNVTCVAIYGATMVMLYTVSTLYHALGLNRAKVIFRSLDHCTIFLLIAGTYTPITLVSLGGVQGWVLFALVWGAAVLGIVLNAVSVERFKVISMVCYLAMGWVVVFSIETFIQHTGAIGFWCLLAGGLCYTLGAVLYGIGKKVPYMHAVFHLFVLAGSALHTAAVYQVVK